MATLTLLRRCNVPIRLPYLSKFEIKCEKSSSSSSSDDSSSDSSSENARQLKPNHVPKEENQAIKKLNSLLQKMIQEDHSAVSNTNIKLSQPVGRTNKQKIKEHKIETLEKQTVSAVKAIAESAGPDAKQVESELLLKLLNVNEVNTNSTNLSDIVKGMKIDRETKASDGSRAQQVKNLLGRYMKNADSSTDKPRKRPQNIQRKPHMPPEKINLFGNEALGIFSETENFSNIPSNTTWENMYKRELKLAVTHPPSNYFQQMILWTNQGKLWKFPIDNEQGLTSEDNVCFSEHVFLEKHLEPWCPPKGPIRHFMELVCVGLSKNPYLTVEAKKEHISWYKNYFESKKDLLREVGAIPIGKEGPTKTLA